MKSKKEIVTFECSFKSTTMIPHKRCLLFIIMALFHLSVSAMSYQKEKNGIRMSFNTKSPDSVKHIRVQIITEKIVRITASPKSIKPTESLIVPSFKPTETHWTVEKSGRNLVIKTAKMSLMIDSKNGAITYLDENGQTVLKEPALENKQFWPIQADGQIRWRMRQQFLTQEGEALYGLGQHQSNELNYLGKNETLYQYNTKVSVPFVVSSKNYGLLWDNYSLTRFGDPRPYANLDQFILYDKNGQTGGLTARYQNTGYRNQLIERQEKIIDYETLETVKNFPPNFSFNNAVITWEGDLQAKESGLFRFNLYYAGYTKVWLDDSLVVAERWRTSWNPNNYKFAANFTKGEKRHLRIEWKPDGGVSYLGLKALSPVPDSIQNRLSFWSEMGKQMDYYVVLGKNADEVIKGYRFLTGKAQIMPKWAMGYWQSRERYKTQQELLSVLSDFRQRRIPIDNIVQDWSYWKEDAWGSHVADSSRFPDLKGMVEEVHRNNARIMISVWPKFYAETQHFKDFDKHGWMYKQAIQDSVKDWIGKGYIGSFYDAFSRDARQLFWKQLDEHLYNQGFDAWWMDASEPDILSNADINYRKKLMNPTALGSSTEYFNAYGLMNAKGIYEGQRSKGDNQRVFLLTRSGFAGSQKYAACIWSGDIGTRWEDMKAQITAGLNYAISGNPYWTMDDGGFCVEKRYESAKEGSEDKEEWRELQVRWHQFGCFAPIFRSHGQYPYREPWNIAPAKHPAYYAMVWYNQLRYRLMPYIYTLAAKCHFDDFTIMRPLMMDFNDDQRVHQIDDQFCMGNQLMVCPVTEYKARNRMVYFPKGKKWYDLYQGKTFEGGQAQNVQAPYERIPVFVPSGSILPVGKVVENTTEVQRDLTLFVYAGSDGSFTLYEDENTNYNYEKGAYSFIKLTWNDTDKVLQIGKRKGSYPGMIQTRSINLVLVDENNPTGLDKNEIKGVVVNYAGEQMDIKL